jgi:fibronectin-binding autotransporter adhesin
VFSVAVAACLISGTAEGGLILQLQGAYYNSGTGTWTATVGGDATQADITKQATIPVETTQNSSAVVSFDGVNDFLTLTVPIAQSQPVTIFAVVRPNSTSTMKTIVAGTSNSLQYRIMDAANSSRQQAVQAGTANIGNSNTGLSTTSGMFSVIDIAYDNTSGAQFRLNGGADGSAGPKSASGVIDNVGARNAGTTELFSGSIAEIRIYDSVLSLAQIQQIEADLTAAYLNSLNAATWTGSPGSSWATAGNWSTGIVPNSAGSSATLAGGAAGTITLDGDTRLSSLTFNNATKYTIAQGTGGTLSMVTGAAKPSITVLSGSHEISAPVAIASLEEINVVNSGDALTLSGQMTGDGGLTKSGAGTLVLAAGDNAYSGATTISGGTLKLAGVAQTIGTASYTTANTYTFAPASDNVLIGLSPTANSNGSGGVESTGPVTLLTDGVIIPNNANTYTIGTNASLTYTLGAAGYDVTKINIYSGWNDSGRENITLGSISYSTVANPTTFTAVSGSSVNYEGGTSIALASLGATGGILAANVYAIRFNFGSQENGYVGYRELEVVGTTVGVLPATTAVQIAGGSALDLNGTTQTIASLADYGGSGGSVVNSAIAQPLILTVNPSSGSTTFSGTIGDSGAANAISLVKSGAGVQVLSGANTYHGITYINAGTLNIQNNTALGTGGHNVATMTWIRDGAALELQNNITTNEHAHFRGAGPSGLGAIRSISGNNTMTDSYCLDADSTIGVDAGTLTFQSTQAEGPLYQQGGAWRLTKVGAGTMIIAGSSSASYTGGTTISAGTLQLGNATYNGCITGDVVNNAALVFANATAQTFGGNISGAGTLTKNAAGALTLTGNNTYNGATTVRAGTLVVGGASAIPSGAGRGDLTVRKSGVLDLGGVDTAVNGLWGDGTVANSPATAGTNNVISVGGNDATSAFYGTIRDGTNGTVGLTKTGAGTLTLGGRNTYTGPTAINQGTLRLAGNAAPTAGVVAHYTFDGNTDDTTGNHNGTLVGTGASYTTGRAGDALNFTGSQQVTVPYAADLGMSSYTVSAWVNLTVDSGNLGIVGTRFGGDATFDYKARAGDIHGDIGDGTGWINTGVDIAAGNTGTDGQGGDLPLGQWYLVTYVVDDAAKQFRLYIDGDLKNTIGYGGTALFMKAGQTMGIGNCSGAEYMNGRIDDVYLYNRALSQAEVQALATVPASSSDLLPTGTALSIASGATLDLNGVAQTIGSLADGGGGGGRVTNGAAGAPVILTINPVGGSTSFSGIIEDGASPTSLVKSGAGTQVFAGGNTYGGTTTLHDGTLLVNGTHTGGGAYNVLGGTLGGTGTIGTNNANVTINGGRLAPGASAGTLTFALGSGVLDLSSAGTGDLVFELGPTDASDKVVLTTGTLDIGTGTLDFADFDFQLLSGFGLGTYTLFDTNAPIAGSLGTDFGSVGGHAAYLRFDGVGYDLLLDVVPEPSTLALAAFGLLGLSLVGRRGRRRV